MKHLESKSFIEQLSGYASEVVEEHLADTINEIDAIASLLTIAEYAPDTDRFDYTVDELNAILLPRIQKLARLCRENARMIINGQEPGFPESL
jgi:hypothetical protein